jgi:ketosteroid isomerase-like protein
MNKLIVLILSSVCMGVAFAGPPPPHSCKDLTAVHAIEQLEQDMGDAMVRVDIDRLNQIYADDFVSVGSSGKIFTKEDVLRDFRSFHDKLVSFEIGPMSVQVFDDVALAYGSVSEKRIRDGKDTSGEFVWMDILKKRAGKWVVVRSTGARFLTRAPA